VKAVVFLISMILASITVAHAEVYKWVDEEGNVHFTDAPPPKQKTEEVKIDRAPTPPVAASSSSSWDDSDEESENGPSDRELCTGAMRNLRRYAPVWERKVRAKMPQMSDEKREEAERGLTKMNSNISRMQNSMGQCVKNMDKSSHRNKTECMANAANDTMAMYCVM
jgi:hypothetical protein